MNDNNFKKPYFINPEHPDKKCTKSFANIDNFTGKCPKCGNILHADFTFLPISTKEFMRISGYLCNICFCFYTDWASKIRDIICKNNNLSDFYVDGLSGNKLIEYEKKRIEDNILKQKAQEEKLKSEKTRLFFERRTHLRNIKAGLVLIPIKFNDTDLVTDIILVKNENAANSKKHILYYLSDDGKNFLYIAYKLSYKKTGVYKDKKYHINGRPIYKTADDALELPDFFRSELLRVEKEQLAWQKAEEERVERLKKEKLLRRKEPLFKKDSSIILIPVEFIKSQERIDVVIVKDENDEDIKNNYFYYGSDAAKEFLTAAYADARKGYGYYNGKYTVYDTPLYRDENIVEPPCNFIPTEIYIKTHGGFSDSIKNKSYELVYILVYSPLYLRYEFLKATYNKLENYCFTDIGYYRQYIENFGKPVEIQNTQFILYNKNNKEYISSFKNMNEESLLKAYGYNVDKANDLSDSYRRKLVKEIIDLGIMTSYSVVKFLESLISTRKPRASHRNAVYKWIADKNYILNYVERPQRFLIPKVSRLF